MVLLRRAVTSVIVRRARAGPSWQSVTPPVPDLHTRDAGSASMGESERRRVNAANRSCAKQQCALLRHHKLRHFTRIRTSPPRASAHSSVARTRAQSETRLSTPRAHPLDLVSRHTSPISRPHRPAPTQATRRTCAPARIAPGHHEADVREAARAAARARRRRRRRPLGRPAARTPAPRPVATARAHGARGALFRPR